MQSTKQVEDFIKFFSESSRNEQADILVRIFSAVYDGVPKESRHVITRNMLLSDVEVTKQFCLDISSEVPQN